MPWRFPSRFGNGIWRWLIVYENVDVAKGKSFFKGSCMKIASNQFFKIKSNSFLFSFYSAILLLLTFNFFLINILLSNVTCEIRSSYCSIWPNCIYCVSVVVPFILSLNWTIFYSNSLFCLNVYNLSRSYNFINGCVQLLPCFVYVFFLMRCNLIMKFKPSCLLITSM